MTAAVEGMHLMRQQPAESVVDVGEDARGGERIRSQATSTSNAANTHCSPKNTALCDRNDVAIARPKKNGVVSPANATESATSVQRIVRARFESASGAPDRSSAYGT